MSSTAMMSSGRPDLSPALQDLVEKCTDLAKLSIVQGLAAEAQPSAFRIARERTLNGSTRRNLGAIVSDRLRALPPNPRRNRGDYRSQSPLERLYDSSIRSLARGYNVDFEAPATPFEQAAGREFQFMATELVNPKKLELARDDLFTLRVEEEDAGPEHVLRSLGIAVGRMDVPALRASMAGGNVAVMSPAVRGILAGSPARATATVGGASSIVLNKGLHFRVHEVRCIDETNPEFWGSDEIAMGGVAVSDDGSVTKINEFKVRDGFDDGDKKTYSPPRVLKSFSLEKLQAPADFMVTVALAEKDSGGFASFLKELWEAIKDEVELILVAVGAAAGAAIGAGSGALAGSVAGPIGTIIGVVAGAIVGALIGWLIGALSDDIFEPQAAAIHLPSSSASFAGGALVSPTMSLNFRDHGGYYRVYYSWELVRSQ